MAKKFAIIRRKAPEIHVFNERSGVTVLKPGSTDGDYDSRRYSTDYIRGTGSKDDPYTYISAANVSPHYAIVDLWFEFRSHTGPISIKVNNWTLEVKPDGVVAEDGHFTKLS